MSQLMMWVIKGYQGLISPLLPSTCRFYPSCSQYAVQALRTHGSIVGLALTFYRILRCNPLCEGGLDPVPTCSGEHHAD
jgi:hypothetical protein